MHSSGHNAGDTIISAKHHHLTLGNVVTTTGSRVTGRFQVPAARDFSPAADGAALAPSTTRSAAGSSLQPSRLQPFGRLRRALRTSCASSLNHPRLLDERNDLHRTPAFRTHERIDFINSVVTPFPNAKNKAPNKAPKSRRHDHYGFCVVISIAQVIRHFCRKGVSGSADPDRTTNSPSVCIPRVLFEYQP